jgi:peptide/nickel transport system substrate-binding protein
VKPPPRFRVRRAVQLVPVLAALACGGESAAEGEGRGTVIVAVAADADFLLPPLVRQLVGKQVFDQIYDPLAMLPASMVTLDAAGFEPRLATSWEWSPDSLAITFTLDPRARFHDGHPVRAADVKFSAEFIKDPAVASGLAGGLANLDSITTPDSLHATAWFARRTSEQFYALVNSLPVMPEHLLAGIPREKVRESDAARNPVGSGRFRFRRWVPGSLIEIVADTANYRGRPSIDRVIWSVSPDPTSLWARLVSEEVDLVEVLRGEPLTKVAAAPATRTVPYQSLDYAYVTFNTRVDRQSRAPHPVLGDVGVRRALAMAADRATVVRNVFDTLAHVAAGPFVRAQWSADTTIAQPVYDPSAARALLDSLGWKDSNGDGIREKNGRPLSFSLAFPTSSTPRRQSATLLQAQWKDVGADVRLEDLENNTFGGRMVAGKFDAVMSGMHVDASPADVRQVFGSPDAPNSGEANYGSYASAEVDRLVDSAATEFNTARAKALYRRAYQRIVDDAAAIFLYEPKLVAGLHRRIETGPLRNDGWWITVGNWTIDPAQRLARDRIPLAAPLEATADSAPAK